MIRTAALLALALCASAASAAPPNGALVSTDWLAANLQNPALRIVEVSVDSGVYERGHIPGAQKLVWQTDLVDTVSRDIASPEQFRNVARRLGIGGDETIVIYGDNSNWFAAWAAWVFDIYGIPNVKLLDGGRKKWEAEGRPLATAAIPVAPGRIDVPIPKKGLRAKLSDVLAVVNGHSHAKLVDVRSVDEFEGRLFAPPGSQELAIRAGHIPGARNVPWSRAVNPDGTIKSREELRKLYAEAGIDGSSPVIVYCRIGERASHTWFALSKLLGYDVRNYDGSWTEYGNVVGVPITNKAGTVWAVK